MKEINKIETALIVGGNCECTCYDPLPEHFYSHFELGDADNLLQCAQACEINGLKTYHCTAIIR